MSELLVSNLGEVGNTGIFAELRMYPDTPTKKLTLYRRIGTERMVLGHFPLSVVVQLGEFLGEVAATYGVE